jgi:nicotinamide-nucleotide amidase
MHNAGTDDVAGAGPSSSDDGSADDVGLAEQIAALLDGRTVATAESLTAGRVAERFACVTSATDFLRGGLVAYQDRIKRDLLGVTADSVFSERAVVEMAVGVCRLLDADVATATSGLAGDDPLDGVPPGTVFIATAVCGRTRSRHYRWDGAPEYVCERATHQALVDLLVDLA